jgi:hypothetical protein
MGVLRNLPSERTAIGFGHPVLGLDELVGGNPRLEGCEPLRILDPLDVLRLLQFGRVHEALLSLGIAFTDRSVNEWAAPVDLFNAYRAEWFGRR